MIGLSVGDISFIPLFIEFKWVLLILHLLGFAIGVGGATISDILFFKFLYDFKISISEDKVLRAMSQIIWMGLFISIISGVGLWLGNMEALNTNPKFLVKVIVVAVITINGAFLNLMITPKLTSMSFKNKNVGESENKGMHVKKTHGFRRLAFALGAISFTSWYSAFILGFFKTTPFNFPELISIYVGILFLAVVGSQISEKIFCKSSSTK